MHFDTKKVLESSLADGLGLSSATMGAATHIQQIDSPQAAVTPNLEKNAQFLDGDYQAWLNGAKVLSAWLTKNTDPTARQV